MKKIKYTIEIDCEVHDDGAIEVTCATENIKDEKGEYENMLQYPSHHDVYIARLSKFNDLKQKF
jgi:hypothetical protein